MTLRRNIVMVIMYIVGALGALSLFGCWCDRLGIPSVPLGIAMAA